MLTKIEALHYRALRYINQEIAPFQVLIGPNASGKSTFLDVVAFIADIITKPSLSDAVRERAPDLRDLTWLRESDWLELAVEARIPKEIDKNYPLLRYEVRIGINSDAGELELLGESLWFISVTPSPNSHYQTSFFPESLKAPDRITRESNQRTPNGWRKILNKTEAGNDYFRSETTDWNNMFRLGPRRATLANLPEDESRFPASVWFKRFISEGVQRIMLNSEALRRPNPPQTLRTFLPDGSN